MAARPDQLRERAARGTVINAAFLVATNSLGVLRGFVLAGLLTRSDYGVTGILAVSIGTLFWLKQAGIGDKYVQQADDDEIAFQRAFSLEVLAAAVFAVVLLGAAPLAGALYDEPRVILPGLAVIAVLPAYALQSPLWILYRRMDFARQRRLQIWEPVVAFTATIGLAVAGVGYWAVILGLIAGAWAGAIVAVLSSPYPLRLRFDGPTLRSYATFSGPIVVASLSGIVIAQSAVLVIRYHLNVEAVGVVALATSIGQYATQVDDIVTTALYPAVCAVRDRGGVLHEAFTKSNRLVLMVALPASGALALFAGDLVNFALGSRWDPAIGVLRAAAISVAIDQLGYNWKAFVRARGWTRPIAWWSVIIMATWLAAGIPSILVFGLPGFGYGIVALAVASVITRSVIMRRILPGFSMIPHAIRAVAPLVPAVAVVFAARALEKGPRRPADAIAELVLFFGVSAVVTVAAERRLVREIVGYLRRPPLPAPAAVL
jgi:O-antigen/teichoic acid export membrane protein